MADPTIIEYQASASVVLKTVISATARLGYTLGNVNNDAGLVTFYAGKWGVTGSAVIEETGTDTARLIVSGNVSLSELTPAAVVGGGALLASVFSRGRWQRKAVEALIEAVDERLDHRRR